MDLNTAFKSTSKLLFGQEIGELPDFEAYLREATIGKDVKSFFSGKDLWVAYDYYCGKARFFDYNEEIKEVARLQSKPLDINRIKDIDSLLDAARERLVYSGNKVLGNSHYITHSDHVTDSSHVLNSSIVIRSKYIAYSYLERDAEYVFSCTSSGDSSYIMRCFNGYKLKRCFECCTTGTSSDCYFCHNLLASTDCMFSFNLRNSRNTIGNIPLEKPRYAELKKKLVGDMAEELRKNKRLGYSIIDMITS